jgi:hypothetical protein
MMRALAFFLLWAPLANAAVIDHSHEIFLPKELKASAAGFRDFPLFWWNFIIVDKTAESDPLPVCRMAAEHWKDSIRKFPCAMGPQELRLLTDDWLADTPRRYDYPADLLKQMNVTLAKASLPLPEGVLPLLRKDPLGTLNELMRKASAHIRFHARFEHGMILDPSGTRVMIPVQLSFSPADNARTRSIAAGLERMCRETQGCTKISFFGPHAGTLENEDRIRADVAAVSWAGILGALLLAGFIFYTRRHRLVLLLPILGAGVLLAAVVTGALYGGIHGITLAFGPGIIGLALDYGVHAVFLDPRSKHTWKSNAAGLLTTLAILIIMLFSQIPLLRQMMTFSVLGLTFSFFLFYFILRRWPSVFATKPYSFAPKHRRLGEVVAVAMVLASPLVFLNPIELGVQHMNYESARTIDIRQWFVNIAGVESPYWVAEEKSDPLGSSHATKAWAEANGIAYEGLAAHLPTIETQSRHLATWQPRLCPESKLNLTQEIRRFFEPFLNSVACANLQPRDPRLTAPLYAGDFLSEGRWVSLLFPKSEAQLKLVREKFPDAHTPREMFEAFPRIFLFELAWMVPLAFGAALIFLWRHFRGLRKTFLSIVPFLAGVGCYAVVAAITQQPLSFISLIGLLMVFGFSLDYGIFVVDLLQARNEGKYGVWSALSLCSFATLAGFAPLIFAKHPVLNDLGHTLFWGSLGTYIGTFWGIPSLYRKLSGDAAA